MKRQVLQVIVLMLASMVAFFTAQAAVGDVVASATSQKTWMDMVTCTNTVITIGQNAKPEKLAYSGWTWFLDGSSSRSVTFTDSYDTPYDGGVTRTVAQLSGEGIFEWLPDIVGAHTIRMVISNGPTYEKKYVTATEAPSVTIDRGTDPGINGGFSCVITSSQEHATIYFTTDGSEPTRESRVYVGPFAINPAIITVVKAFCEVDGWPRSHTMKKVLQKATNLELVATDGVGQVMIDTRAGTETLEARETEPIVWSGLWSADANANVTVTVNGAPFVSGKGAGVEAWTPTAAGVYNFQHTTVGSSEMLTATFNVVAKDIALANVVVDCSDVTYSGSAFTPAIQSATWGEKALVAGTDYTLAYSGNVNAGKATITLTGNNLFNGTYITNFIIKPKTVTAVMVGIVDNVTYTGSAFKPEPTITDSERGVTLVKGTDYLLSWGENTTAGSGSVTVTGKGNYTGSITKTFTIGKAEVTPPVVASKTFTGGLLRADVSATERYTVVNDGGVDAGNYTVTLTLTDAVNWRWKGGDSNPLELTFSITKASNSWMTQPSISGWTYGQAANAPNMGSAKFGTVQVAYSATPQNAGNYTATFTVVGTANYDGLTKDVQFMIAKGTYDMSGARWSAEAFTYDGTEKSVVVEGLPAGVSVQSYANNAKTAAGNYTAHATLSYDTTNYNAPSIADKSWSIARKSIAGATVTLGPALVYSGSEQAQNVTGVKIDGLDATYTVNGNRAIEAGMYTLTVTGTGNFTGTATKQWQIRPDGIVETVTPYDGIYDGVGHGITVAVAKPDGAVVKYAYAANGPYAEGEILFTNVTEEAITVWYVVEAANYTTITNSGTVKISPKPLTDGMVTVEDAAYVYDGTAKEPEVTVEDGDPSILTDDDYEMHYADNIAAGENSASVVVTGKGNYTGMVTKHFSIAKAEVTPPTISGKVYTGGWLRADVAASARYTALNDGGLDVGSYPVTLTLTDAANYRWKDGDSNPLNLMFTITKASNSWMTQPSISGWTYGQAANTPNMGSAKFGTVQVAYSATPQNAGSYTATFSVPGTANYDGLTKPVQFTIAKGTYDMSGAHWDYAGEFVYDGQVKMVSVVGMPSGVTATYTGNTATETGSYTAHAIFAYDTQNYNAPTIEDLVWSIGSSELTELEDAFDGLPVAIEPDGNGGWKVTITNDIDSADLPIEIPDNIGHVTIDLNGHDLIGGDGRDGASPSQDAGEDGRPAIVIVPGEGDGDATWLSIVTNGGDSLVKGGDGGDGNPGGNGAAAIKVSDDVKTGVKVDVGTGVTVQGGNGGDSTTGRGGDGGAGVDGDVGTNDGTIIGGNGGSSVSGDGGDGGMGVTGDVGTNNGTISGGKGGASEQGQNGEDGKAVGGNVGGGTGTIVKVKVPVPVITPAEYTGDEIVPQVPESTLWTADVPEGLKDPGTYKVSLTLKDPMSYGWWVSDSTGGGADSGSYLDGATAELSFSIVKSHPTHVSFNANGGKMDIDGMDYAFGANYNGLPVPSRPGYAFDGWWNTPTFDVGTEVKNGDAVHLEDQTFYAKWRRYALWYTDSMFHLDGAAQYDAYLVDPAAGDAVAGTIQVKAGKPGKNGTSKLKLTILVAGRKKASAKGTTFDGRFQGAVDGMALDITLGFSSMTGKVGRYVIDGARNVFTAKDVDSKMIAAQALKKWQGVYTVAWKAGAAGALDARPYQTLSLEVKAKGKVKVAGTLSDGTKVSTKSQLLVGERECAVAVSWTKKGASVACLVWLKDDGTVECGNLPGGASALIANLRAGAKLAAGSALRVDPAALSAAVPGLLEDLLPDGLEIRMKGTSFDVDKPGKVALLKDKSGVDLSKAGTNPSGLKLKYTIKNGTFKGSFTAYALSGGKLKKVKVDVGGVVIGGKGYGAASVKKVGAWELRIENGGSKAYDLGTVTFDANGGTGGTSTTKTHGTTLGTLPTPSRDGHTFGGWWTAASGGTQVSASTVVTGSVTYYAHWSANSYTVMFDANDGSVGTASKLVTYNAQYGSLPPASREGYSFAGWFTAVEGGSQVMQSNVVSVVGDHTLYAHWTGNSYTITYNANGGTGTTPATAATYGTEVTIATCGFTCDGYRFKGWGIASDDVVVAYSAGQHVTNLTSTENGVVNLYAVWEEYTGPVFDIVNGELRSVVLNGNTDIVIPDGVVSIADNAFQSSQITSAVLPDSVEYIGDGAFGYCSSLTNVNIGSGVRAIAAFAFEQCNSQLYEYSAERGLITVDGWVVGGGGDVEVTGVRGIATAAFSSSLVSSLTIGSDIKDIPSDAFACSGVSHITILEGVTNIEDCAFLSCGFNSVVIPASVKRLSLGAFSLCDNLQSIIFAGNAPDDVYDEWALDDLDVKFYVHPGTTGWGVAIPGTWMGKPIEYLQ